MRCITFSETSQQMPLRGWTKVPPSKSRTCADSPGWHSVRSGRPHGPQSRDIVRLASFPMWSQCHLSHHVDKVLLHVVILQHLSHADSNHERCDTAQCMRSPLACTLLLTSANVLIIQVPDTSQRVQPLGHEGWWAFVAVAPRLIPSPEGLCHAA